MDVNRSPDTVTRSIHNYWMLFLFEGVALVALGLLAIVIPSIASLAATLFLGLAFSRKWRHRSSDNFLGATPTWILVVSRVRFARDSCRCRLNRAQI